MTDTPTMTSAQRQAALREIVETCPPDQLLRDLSDVYAAIAVSYLNGGGIAMRTIGARIQLVASLLRNVADLYGGP